ncbi:MAG TPA: hypothetical protein VK009_22920 [Chloroflexota bacterium]|nr:hypothetical protein [Chloroflexota bacterium]
MGVAAGVVVVLGTTVPVPVGVGVDVRDGVGVSVAEGLCAGGTWVAVVVISALGELAGVEVAVSASAGEAIPASRIAATPA